MSAAGFGAKTPLLGYDVAVVCRGLQEKESGLASRIYLQRVCSAIAFEEPVPVDVALLGLGYVPPCFCHAGGPRCLRCPRLRLLRLRLQRGRALGGSQCWRD